MPTSNDPAATIRVGVIGAGLRASAYFRDIPPELEDSVHIVAIADPDPQQRATFGDLIAITETDPAEKARVAARWAPGEDRSEYDDGLELLAEEELDAVILSSPNAQHVSYAAAAMARSLPLMLEKPVATTIDDLARLWQAYQDSDPGHTLVGFVLRYTPFYSAVREVVREGRLGTILSVEINENLGTSLTMRQYRGWRQDTAKSGGWMVEKCCHDFDMLSHLLGASPRRVFSMASARHFRPRPEAEQLDRFQPKPKSTDVGRTGEALRNTMQHSPYGKSNLPDRQVATLEFDNGVLATFTATMAQPRTTRRIRIFGTEGMLEGETAQERITLLFPDPAGSREVTEEQVDVSVGASGHHGGDEVLCETFWHLVAGGERASRAGLVDGIDAVLTAIAVQQSAHSGQAVDLAELRATVFGAQGQPQTSTAGS